jgi:hypothetical protein
MLLATAVTAAIDDCDHNGVKRAGFDCFGIAAKDIKIEPPPPRP